jgi:hypothetical protein
MGLIKRIVDTMRKSDGYAGMAIYRGDCMLFIEGLEPSYTDTIKALFEETGEHFPARSLSLVIRGYTVAVFTSGDMLVLCRSGGRFAARPALPDVEPEFTAGQAPPGLITREEARKEAAAMLKMLMSSG